MAAACSGQLRAGRGQGPGTASGPGPGPGSKVRVTVQAQWAELSGSWKSPICRLHACCALAIEDGPLNVRDWLDEARVEATDENGGQELSTHDRQDIRARRPVQHRDSADGAGDKRGCRRPRGIQHQ